MLLNYPTDRCGPVSITTERAPYINQWIKNIKGTRTRTSPDSGRHQPIPTSICISCGSSSTTVVVVTTDVVVLQEGNSRAMAEMKMAYIIIDKNSKFGHSCNIHS